MKIRKVLFWLHLVVGVASGLIIAVMSLTGTALAFEKELAAWSERDARRLVPAPEGAARRPVEEQVARVQETHPGASASVTVFAHPGIATTVNFSRTNVLYVDPYSGEIREPGSRRMRRFLQVMFSWHRWLGREGEQRDTGKAITGAANLAFLGLAVSGLYLWWPRRWTRKQLRAITVPSLQGHGKARDWNWHNALGFWTAPILIVLTATAVPISYRWGGDLIYTLTGTPKPAGGSPAGPSVRPAAEVSKPLPDSSPLGWEALLTELREQVPNWEQMTFRIPASGAPGSRAAPVEPRPGVVASPVTISVKERGGRPRFSSRQFTLDPYTGSILRQEQYADLDRARQVRSWTRFLHTGEALGPVGQAVAGLASLVAGVLVWTGLALTWRRFFRRRGAVSTPTPVEREAVEG